MSQLFKLKNGNVFVLLEAPGGVYNATQLKKIAELCDEGIAVAKATEDQRLGIFVPEESIPNVTSCLTDCGLTLRNYRDGLHQAVSCLGELCEEHEQDALGTAMELSQSLESLQLESPLRIGVNGCYQCCTPCHTLDIAVVGESSGYRISLGGKNSQVPEFAAFMAEGVPPGEVSALLSKVITLYSSMAEDDESLHDVLERAGVNAFVEALAPYSQDAHDGSLLDTGIDDLSSDLENDADEVDPSENEENLGIDTDEELANSEDGSLGSLEDDIGTSSDELDADTSDIEGLDMTEDLELSEDLEDLDEESAPTAVGSVDEKEDIAEPQDLSDSDLDDINELELSDDDHGMAEMEDDLADSAMNDREISEEPDSETSEPVAAADDPQELDDLETDDSDLNLLETAEDLPESELAAPEAQEMDEDLSLEANDDDLGAISIEDGGIDDSQIDDIAINEDVDDSLDDITLEDPETPNQDELSDDVELEIAEESDFEEDIPDPGPMESVSAEEAFALEDDAPPEVAASEDQNPQLPDDTATFSEAPEEESEESFSVDDDVVDVGDDELDDEESIESKIIAGIDEESAILAVEDDIDANQEDRDSALELLSEDTSALSDEIDPDSPEIEAASDALDAEDDIVEVSADEIEEIPQVDIEEDSLEDLVDEDLDSIADDLDADEIDLDDLDEELEDETSELASREVSAPPPALRTLPGGGDFTLCGVEFSPGKVHLTFATGAYIDIELSQIDNAKAFSIDGKSFVVTPADGGVIIEVDGVKLFQPERPLSAAS
ncbi:MAG: hypothetical protein HRU19_18115 [Pseudobacteriovorax sp.]|nr:hypothetical protein [Pseudobacteriovorax sp.]